VKRQGRGGEAASEDPHHNVELRWQLAVTAGQRDSYCGGDRETAAMVAAARASRGGGCGI
jgi:hypothetical protein